MGHAGGMREDLLPIGQFARLGRLSVKQLRHYDELGLLVPVHVDADSGYRYYHPGQARQALSIALLRSLDVPLTVIGEVLASGTAGVLAAVHEAQEAELSRRRTTLAALERIMAEGLPSAAVHVVRQAPLRARVVRQTAAGPQELGRVTSAAIASLLYGLRGVPQLIGLFPLDLEGPIEVAVALVEEQEHGEELPGGLFASAAHVGPYDQIALTAHALLVWCAEHGHRVHGPLREVYVSDPNTTAPKDLLTHVMVAVHEPTTRRRPGSAGNLAV